MQYLTEPTPEYGNATVVADGVTRVVARNPSVMTYHGTNTYVVRRGGRTIVVDPGPDDRRHVDAVVAATGGQVDWIALTHGHTDHSGAVPALDSRHVLGCPAA